MLVSYDIAAETAPAFNISVYRSSDGFTRDALVGSREIALDADRSTGAHTIEIIPDFVDVREDYRLIAVADPLGAISETSEINNELAFAGGIFRATDGVVHLHGTDAPDSIKIKVAEPANGSGQAEDYINIEIGDSMLTYDADPIAEIHLRLHGDDDVLNVQPNISRNILAFAGAGNDRILSGAGSDWLVGGAGDDFIAGRANRDLIYGDDNWQQGGHDTLLGGAGNDTLEGFAGNDKLIGGSGLDIVSGGPGDDVVDGGTDDDLVWSGKGRDRIVNPPGRKESRDGRADDTILLTTPEELLFADFAAEEDVSAPDSASVQASSGDASWESYGYSGFAGYFWLEPEYGHTYYQPEGEEALITPFTIQRDAASIWGIKVVFDLAYVGAATSADLHSQQTSVSMETGYSGQPVAVGVNDDATLEITEDILVQFAAYDTPGNAGAYVVIDYPDPSQPPPNDTDGDPFSATAYIVDGDLEIWDATPYPVAEADEEQPGVMTAVGQLHLMDIQPPTSAGSLPGTFTFDYPYGITVWTDQQRTSVVPSGTQITQPMTVFVEPTTEVANAELSLNWNYAWNGSMVDRVLVSTFGLDIDTDSNNDGSINGTEAEDEIEDAEKKLGKRIFINEDDDNKNGLPDLEASDVRAKYVAANVSDNDFAAISLNVTDINDLAGHELWLSVDAGLKLWGDQQKKPLADLANKPDRTETEGSLSWHVWEIDAQGVNFPATLYVEGITLGAHRVHFQVRDGGGNKVGEDIVKINVEKLVWPNQDSTAQWDPEKETTEWKGFELASGWFISKSLSDIIVAKRAGTGNYGYIRTEYPQETVAGTWQGTNAQTSDAVLNLNDLAGIGESWHGSTIRIEVSYEYEQSPNITVGDYVDVKHQTVQNLYKPGFFANSGIKIENRSEIQIYDTAALLDSINGGSNETIADTTVNVTGNTIEQSGNDEGKVQLSHMGQGAAWVKEYVGALISGLPYDDVKPMGADQQFLRRQPNETYLQRLQRAPMGAQTMIIDVTRAVGDEDYTFTVTIDNHTETYEDVLRGKPDDFRNGVLYLQSHWGSGIKFTAAKVKKL